MNIYREIVFSYLEEDNTQRAYFRVIPMLTVSGDVHEDARKLWPDNGALRIVPDKNEQFYFKDRMRSLGNFCIMDLTSFPADANKIRTNKNYRPDHEERNQFILYSDTVKPLPDHTFFEVISGTKDDWQSLATRAITPFFYIRSDNTLFGPVNRAMPAEPEHATQTEGTLYDLTCPDGQIRSILCIGHTAAAGDTPDEPVMPVVNRSIPRPPVAAQAPAFVPVSRTPIASKPVPVKVEPAPIKADTVPVKAAVVPTKAEAAATAPIDDAPLPLGKPLTILDESKDFAETIHGLNQPVSSGANLLNHSPAAPATALQEQTVLCGTPLYRAPAFRTSVPRPKNQLQEIVASQWRAAKNEPPAEPLPAGATLRTVDNPVEQACQSMKAAWQVPEAQIQLVDFILSLPGMNAKLESRLTAAFGSTALQSALLNRLQDLEAERLAALVQLDKAKADLDDFRRNALTNLRTSEQSELDHLSASKTEHETAIATLKEQVNALCAQRDALQSKIDELQSNTLPAVLAKAIADAQLVAPVSGQPIRLAGVSGSYATQQELVERILTMYKQCSLNYSRNSAVALLALMTLCRRVGVAAANIAPASTLMLNLAGAMGWRSAVGQQVSAEQHPQVAPRTVDSTPVFLLTTLPAYAPLDNVTKIMLTRNSAVLARNPAYDLEQWPILNMPLMQAIAALPADMDGTPVSAAALKQWTDACVVTEDMTAVMKPILSQLPPLSGNAQTEMMRFIACCAGLMEGGLATACDWAILLWLLPALERTPKNVAMLKPLLAEFPMACARL